MDFASLPILDESHFGEVTGGDQEFKRDIATTFMETVTALLEDLEAANDEAICRAIAHRIKGSSLNIGFVRLGAVAAEAEKEFILATRNSYIALLRSTYEDSKFFLINSIE